MQQNLCRLIAAVVVSLLAAFGCLKANAQTADSLRQQYESTCTEELYKLSSDMRTTCDSMRSTCSEASDDDVLASRLGMSSHGAAGVPDSP